MKILVTGGTGLVGSRLLKRLALGDAECSALVRSGKAVPTGIIAIEGDLDDIESLKKAVSGVDAIIHLAAVFRTPNEDEIWKANLEGTKNLITATAQVNPTVRFTMASTTNVYSDNLVRPAKEDDSTGATAAYPASKIAAETELRKSGLNWSIIRFPFVYGDGDGHILSIMPHIEAMGLHPAKRYSVIHHEDIATAIDMALEGTFDGKTINIADDATISIYEMVQLVGQSFKPSAEPLVNPWKGQVDASLARSLGFSPKIQTMFQASREDKL
jgi:UDP-glucose 4-epimerase